MLTKYMRKVPNMSSQRESSTNGAMDLAQQVAKMADEVTKLCSTKLKLQDLCKFLNKRKILGGKMPMCSVIIVLNEGIFHQILHILSEKEVSPRFQEE